MKKKSCTRCLYDEEPYGTAFTARVISCAPAEMWGTYAVVLNRTLFFPEQGGQKADEGFLQKEEGEQKRCPVLDVQIKNGVIYHILETSFAAGEKVDGQIDWALRFDYMQQHTGEHIASGLAHRLWHYNNVGFHLSRDVVTMDLDGQLTKEQLLQLEEEANKVICANLPVEISYPNWEELAAMEYRSKKELDEQVRIVTIPGVDVCACCAPHVAHTGEIGMLKIIRATRYKKGTRLEIACGRRALKEFQIREDVISSLTQLLSTNMDELPRRVNQLLEDKKQTLDALGKDRRRLVRIAWKEKGKSPSEPLCYFTDEMDERDMRIIINELLSENKGTCALFAGSDEEGYHFVMGSNIKNCRNLFYLFKEILSAKGGGTPSMVRGSVKAPAEDIRRLLIFAM